jgi:hypothetical protein
VISIVEGIAIELPGPRPRMKTAVDSVILTIPARRPWGFIALLTLVTYGIVRTIHSVAVAITGASPHLAVRLAASAVLLALAIGSALAAIALLWFLFGRERIVLHGGAVTQRRSIAGVTVNHSKRLGAYAVTVAPLEWNVRAPYPWHVCVGMTEGTLLISTTEGALRVGGALDRARAEDLASQLTRAMGW